jgi:hypothetical protein
MRHFVSAVCGIWLGLAGAVAAQSQPVVVVELYTSQGCSSCPPADEFMAMLAMNPNVIALSLHVDYWDYIGWADKFASPQFTARQKAYARAGGSRTIYTPQMIIDGQERVEGHAPEEVAQLLRKHLGTAHSVSLTLERVGDRVTIRAVSPVRFAAGKAKVQLVRYIPSQVVDIERGENAGRTMTYFNVVTSWQVLGDWDGAAPLELSADAKGKQPVVVILQAEGPADVLAAAQLD